MSDPTTYPVRKPKQRYDDVYEWSFEDGQLTIWSHCCTDTFDEAGLRALYDTLEEHYDE